MNDGQGQQYGNAGLPFAAEATAAPAGSDAEAMLALAIPCQSTLAVGAIDLGSITPPGLFGGKCGCANGSATVAPNYLPWLLGAIGILLLVRR